MWEEFPLHRAGVRQRGLFSFTKENSPLYIPQEKGIRLAVSDLNDSYASGMGMPARGGAAFSVAIRFASASIIRCRSADLVGVQTNFRLTRHYSMRQASAMPHSVGSLPPNATSHAPHDSKARLQNGDETHGFMAKPCTPHLHCAARAALQATNCQCRGSRGTPLAFLWGI